MSRKRDAEISMLVEMLELIHAENLTIYNSILILGTIEEGTRLALFYEWDKRFQKIKKMYDI